MTPKQKQLARLGIVLAVMLTALFLRLARLPYLTMWSDEYHSFRISSLPLSEILSGHYTELNPPLYFALLHLQRGIFGDSEIAMRGLSLVFAILSLPLFFRLAQHVFKAFIPSIAALTLMAFHPMLIYFSVEIRSYSQLVFFGLLAFLSCVKLLDEARYSPVWAIVLAFSLSGCLYTHHFGAIVPVSIAAYAVTHAVLLRRWSRRETLALISVVISGVAYLPGILMLQRQAASYRSDPANWIPLTDSLQVFIYSIHHPWYETLLTVVAVSALILGVIVLAAQWRARPQALLVLWGLVAAVAMTLLLRFVGINIASRYLVVALPLVLIAIAGALHGPKWAWRRVIQGIALATVVFYIVYGVDFALNTKWENQQASWKADWKQISDVIGRLRAGDEPVVMMGWDATPVQYYLAVDTLTSYELEMQASSSSHSSYLVVMTPNSRSIPVLDSAVLLYESEEEGVRILRLDESQPVPACALLPFLRNYPMSLRGALFATKQSPTLSG